jgi:putative ABC transport system substrate-binding protein
MKRRDFVTGLLLAATTRCAVAEEATKTYRIAIANPSFPVVDLQKPTSSSQRFLGELRRLGYAEGKNLVVDYYSAEGHMERYPEVVREAVGRNPDVIVTLANSMVHAFAQMAKTIPIVAMTTDPVGDGLAASLARPGGNITGSSGDGGIELMAKYLEILREIVPSASKFAYLGPEFRWAKESPTLLDAARRLGVSLIGVLVDSPFQEPEFRRAFAAIAQERVDVMMVGFANQFMPSRRLIVELAEKNRLPVIYPYRVYMDAGGLVAYAVEYDSLWTHMAHQVDQIFKGANPADIPIQQATTFRLMINLKTAKTLGLTIPPTLLARADEVIE